LSLVTNQEAINMSYNYFDDSNIDMTCHYPEYTAVYNKDKKELTIFINGEIEEEYCIVESETDANLIFEQYIDNLV
jgi:hypothetical protein